MTNTHRNDNAAAPVGSGTKQSVNIDGVVVRWNDTRYMATVQPDDLELRGEFEINVSADGADLDAVRYACVCAQVLRAVANFGDMVCPHSDLSLRPVGLDTTGGVILQIFRDRRKRDAVPCSVLSELDPTNYSADPVAEKSVAWMRGVGRAILDLHAAIIHAASEPGDHARRALHTIVYDIQTVTQGQEIA